MSSIITATVANVNSLLTLGFTKLEMWVTTDMGNTFQEITSSSILPASLTSEPASTQFQMGGHLLKFSLNGNTENSINFSSINMFWTPTQVASTINDVVPGVASVVNNSVVLTSPTNVVNGRANTILITYNDATDLGFVAGQKGIGTDARLTLVTNTVIYSYVDLAGQAAYQYKWRFSNNGINPISPFTDPVFPTPSPVSVPLSIGTMYFVGLNGTPQQRTITIVTDFTPLSVASNGINFSVGNDLPLTYTSDINGFLQVPLAQGAKVRIGLEGTAYVREFIVPSTSTFDIATVMSSAVDPFTIQVPTPLLTRRIL